MGAYLALAGLQLAGSYQMASITRQNGELQNDIANMNSQFAELDAFNARAKGQTDAARYGEQIQKVQAADKAAEAGAGITIGYGTAKDIDTDNKIAGMVNTLQIQRQAQNQAAGFQNQAINIRLGGSMTQLQSNLNASAQQMSGLTSAISTGVAGYAYSQSTGKGTTSHTGTDATPGTARDDAPTVHVTSTGDGIANQPTWYADNPSYGYDSNHSGFYGYGPRSSYGGSFTQEAG